MASFQHAKNRLSDRVRERRLGDKARRRKSAERHLQERRHGECAFALVAYRMERGAYPESLLDLVPDYLPEPPVDLFSGAAPRYVREKEGFLLYSVGVNGCDDGGTTYSDEPNGDDLRLRMPPETRE